MAKRSIGDIYLVVSEGKELGILQDVGADPSVPGSNLVNVIGLPGLAVATMSESEFHALKVDFAAHVFLKAGETLGLWKKVAKRGATACACSRWFDVDANDLRKPVSGNWRIWDTGGPVERARNVSQLEGREFGFVMSPLQIVARMETGAYTLPMPKPSFG